ncbi:MAG TPA: TIGR03668 family PPOX class F420-dependent oxidoreductase [Acidimicrobiales bacterium]|nr:TIGR03668 family PPOX class F420-dependent oxidoreductase [Acidimicrobiales bacterium]
MDVLDADLRERVGAAAVARLATVRPDGRPHVVPITFALVGDTIVTAVDHKPKTTTSLQRLRNIEAHPAASVLVDHYEEDWSRLWWARADGTAQAIHEGPSRQEAVERLVAKYEAYRRQAPRGPVIVLHVHRWAHWSG